MPTRVLIADDDSVFLKLLTYELERRELDIDLKTAENGEDARTLFAEHKPDVVLLDLRMPVEDGFEVLEHLKEQQSQTPVIILTHFREPEYLDRAKQLGAKDLLVKSDLSIEELVDRLIVHF